MVCPLVLADSNQPTIMIGPGGLLLVVPPPYLSLCKSQFQFYGVGGGCRKVNNQNLDLRNVLQGGIVTPPSCPSGALPFFIHFVRNDHISEVNMGGDPPSIFFFA